MSCFSSYSERLSTSLVSSVARVRTANTSSHHSTARSRSWPMPLRLRFLGIKSGFLRPRPPSPSRGDPCPFHPCLVRYCAVLSGMPLRKSGANNVRPKENWGPFLPCSPPTPLDLSASKYHGGRAACGAFVLGHCVHRRDRPSARTKMPPAIRCSDL